MEMLWTGASVDRIGRFFASGQKGLEVPGVIPGRKETTEKHPGVEDNPGSNQSKGGFAGMAVECVNQGLLVRYRNNTVTNTITRKTENASGKSHFPAKKRE